MSDGIKHGSEPKIHQSAAETRERAYDRARRTGITPDAAKEIAERAAREAHTKLDRR